MCFWQCLLAGGTHMTARPQHSNKALLSIHLVVCGVLPALNVPPYLSFPLLLLPVFIDAKVFASDERAGNIFFFLSFHFLFLLSTTVSTAEEKVLAPSEKKKQHGEGESQRGSTQDMQGGDVRDPEKENYKVFCDTWIQWYGLGA